MAIQLDKRAQAVLAHRRAGSKGDTILLRLERGSLRGGVPWVLVAGWAQRRPPADAIACPCDPGACILAELRIARYAQSHDLTISGARLGPWEWLVVADPFACEHLLEWERAHRKQPAAGLPSVGPVTNTGSRTNTKAAG